MKHSRKLGIAAAIAMAALYPGASVAATVIGSWQTSTSEGWINNANGLSITDAANTSIYSFVAGVVSGYPQSLRINQAGFGSTLRLNLESQTGGREAFLANNLISFTFSVPSAAASGSTAGFSQLYAFNINASGYGYNNVGDRGAAATWSSGWTATGDTANNDQAPASPNFYFYNGAPARTQTVTYNYASILPLITATPSSGYIQLQLTFNNGGGAPGEFYMNNVVLSSSVVPEPSSLALIGLGGAGWLLARRQRNQSARSQYGG